MNKEKIPGAIRPIITNRNIYFQEESLFRFANLVVGLALATLSRIVKQ